MSNEISTTGKLNILLVENSRTARAVMTQILTNSGYQVFAVATGPQALEFLDNQQVDLIIMDVFMPLMNGYEVAELIRSSDQPYSNTPILAYTGSKNPRDASQCKESGMNDYLTKSDDNKELISWLDNFYQQNPK